MRPRYIRWAREDGGVDPVVALRRIAFLLERQLEQTHRIKAYRKAADRLEAIGPEASAVADDDEGEDAVEWSPV